RPLEAGGHDPCGGRLRLASQGEGRLDLTLSQESVDFTQERPRAGALDAKVDEFPNDDDEADGSTRAKGPHHPAAVLPGLGNLLRERQIRSLESRNLQQSYREGAKTAQSYLRREGACIGYAWNFAGSIKFLA